MTPKLFQITGRLAQAIPSVLVVIILSFILTRMLPGDPAVYFAGDMADKESIEQMRRSLGLDRSWLEQFYIYIINLIEGDWGISLTTGQPVTDELLARLPASLELTIFGLILSIAAAVPLGIAAANHKDSWIDHFCRILVTAGVSLSIFFTGLFLVYIFYFLLGLAQLILPAATLGLFALAPIARMTRSAMLGALKSDYVRTARASGLSRKKILLTYALQNAALPIFTTLGMVFSFLLGANVLVEKVFSWPGVGLYAIEALIASDYAAVQGFVLTMALLFVFVNLTIDIILTLIDPRVGFDD